MAVQKGNTLDMTATPVITVFGGGVAGLSAAHELIERGFIVQVVEPRESHFKEYACEVGGFAASQYTRVKMTEELYPSLFVDSGRHKHWQKWDTRPPGGVKIADQGWTPIFERKIGDPDEARALIAKLRTRRLRPVQRRIPFVERIVFEEFDSDVDLDMHDDLGVSNRTKLEVVAAKMLWAIHIYREDLIAELEQNLGEVTHDGDDVGGTEQKGPFDAALGHLADLDPEVRLRETLLLQIRGHHGTVDDGLPQAGWAKSLEHERGMPEIAWERTISVKKALIEIVQAAFDEALRDVPSKEESAQARHEVETTRYYSTLDLTSVVRAFFTTWSGMGLLPAKQKGRKKAQAPLADQRIENYMVVMIEGSDERPPLAAASESKSDGDYDARDPADVHREAIHDRKLDFHRVEFDAVEHILPGEHGYRFFPSFYQNLFDVMKRTPVLDDAGIETGARAFDQLVTPPPTTFAKEGAALAFQLNRPHQSKEAKRENMESTMRFFGATLRDGLLFENQMMKFQTSCQARRKLYERMSWLEFAYGHDERKEPDPAAAFVAPSPYSKDYQQIIRKMPQALVAMRAGESDARSFGVCTTQMLKDYHGETDRVDMVLNGPTSDAWLRPWKRYLQHNGVRFFIGHLHELELADVGGRTKVTPVVHGPAPDDQPRSERPRVEFISEAHYPERRHFYVLASPFQPTARLFGRLEHEERAKIDGDLGKLCRFIFRTNPKFEAALAAAKTPAQRLKVLHTPLLVHNGRDRWGQPSDRFVQPLRDFTGMQFYFDKRVRIAGGHCYYLNAEWGLTSLAQAFLWRRRPTKSLGYLGELTIDLGNPYAPWPAENGKSVWQCSREEVAKLTWEQIHEVFPEAAARVVPEPQYYHIDRAIRFKDDDEYDTGSPQFARVEGVAENGTPFLIQLPGQFEHLPGYWTKPTMPDTTLHTSFTPPTETEYDDFDHLHYAMSNGAWVVAGALAQTHTRLNSMEAANESARHAVNAIIHALLPPESEHGSFGAPLPLMTAHSKPGMYCDVYNLEKDENPDYNFLKRLDRELMRNGMPHILDILDTFEHIRAMPAATKKQSKAEQVMYAMQAAMSAGEQQFGATGMADVARQLEANLRQNADLGKEIIGWLKSRTRS